jgi:hypothetical protein
MRRTRMMLAGAVVALSLSTAGTGGALAQTHDDDHSGGEAPSDLAEQCASYSFFEWLIFHHECHGHGGGEVYWPSFV